MRTFLGVPLFWKILLGNLVVATLGVTAGVMFMRGPPYGGPLLPVLLVIAGVVAAIGLINAALIHLALRPLQSVEVVARDVSEGDLSARVPEMVLADPEMRRLSRTMNNMLEFVEDTQARQEESSRHLIHAREQERRTVSHGLYSDVAQRLAGVLVRLQRELDHPDLSSHDATSTLAEHIREALDSVRTMARDLRPPELDDLGVRVALEAHARRVRERANVEVNLVGGIDERRLQSNAQLELFRILEQLIANAVRSGASEVTVRFSASESGLVTDVTDDGTDRRRGGPTGETGRDADLLTLHDRARHIGGSLVIDSGFGGGTHFRLVIPNSLAQSHEAD